MHFVQGTHNNHYRILQERMMPVGLLSVTPQAARVNFVNLRPTESRFETRCTSAERTSRLAIIRSV
jgi:hypothetical protein